MDLIEIAIVTLWTTAICLGAWLWGQHAPDIQVIWGEDKEPRA